MENLWWVTIPQAVWTVATSEKAKKAFGNAKVFVNLIDEARVEIEAMENAEVIIYNYSV